MFTTPDGDLIVHSVTLRPDDVIDIAYTQKRFMLPWGYKTETWSFDRTAIADIELLQLIDSLHALIDLVEIKAREGED